jgi:hypothetical protein
VRVELVGDGVAVQQIPDLVAARHLPDDADRDQALLAGGPDPFAELLADRQIQVLLGRFPGLPQPAVDPPQRHRLAHRLVHAAIQDPDEQHPPSRRVELVRLGQELHPGQLRHPLVGDNQRDRNIPAAQPLQHPKSPRG